MKRTTNTKTEDMKANELRLGNLVETFNGNVESITGIYTTPDYIEISTDNCAGLIEDFKQIPLTEEWLSALGGIDEGYRIKFKAKRKLIVFNWASKIVSSGKRLSWRCYKYNHIKYVHQLQNLYFALTGEELEFKALTNETNDTNQD